MLGDQFQTRRRPIKRSNAHMKMNVLRNLVIPWFCFFIFGVLAPIAATLILRIPAQEHPLYPPILAAGALICLGLNIRTLNRAGIWIAHALPSSLRFRKWPWFFTAVNAFAVALVFFLLGQASWMPLFWQAFVIPSVFTIALFVAVWHLMGPILAWCSTISFSRISAFLMSLPVFVLVPLTAFFLGQTIVKAYLASRPQAFVARSFFLAPDSEPAAAEALVATAQPVFLQKDSKLEEKSAMFREAALSGKACYEINKDLQAALVSKGPEEQVYWAVKSVKCSDLTSIVALPKLAKVMTDHPSSYVRSAAIRAMAKYGMDNVKKINYLILKRITEKETSDVIESAAWLLARIDEEDKKYAINRLKALLDNESINATAAKVLVEDLKQEEQLTEYVAENLAAGADRRKRAVELVCLLPKSSLPAIEPHIHQIVDSVQTGAQDDPAMKALDCMGPSGYQAIRKEVASPQQLDRSIAARAFAEMKVKNPTEALETVETCVRDENEQVRKWCSQSLGKIGAPALPKILDLLKSSESELKDAGKNALNHFDDPAAKTELEKIRAENSGWFASKKKLQIAEAINTALVKVETETALPTVETKTE
jgi:HEAT repeat protein